MSDQNASVNVPMEAAEKAANVPLVTDASDSQDVINLMSAMGTNAFTKKSDPFMDNFYGINHRGVPNALPVNQDQYGATFFTRPCLNLSYNNLRRDRRLVALMNRNPMSYQRIIRHYLDPRGQRRNETSPAVDSENIFIPLLSNTMISMSGWPDIEVENYTSKPGVLHEQWSMYDGTFEIFRNFPMSVNFRNVRGDPIGLLFYVWELYGALVMRGTLEPYQDMLMNNRKDYETRIYRVILDQTRQYVQKIACIGAGRPTTLPIGASFDYNEETPFNRSMDQISINFSCDGAMYNDPITMDAFNKAVMILQPFLSTAKSRAETFRKLTLQERIMFNYRGYPLINLDTYEYEIYVRKDYYERYMNANQFAKSLLATTHKSENYRTGG